MTSKKDTKKKNIAPPEQQAKKVRKPKTLIEIILNVIILTGMVFWAIYFTDKKGWFSPDNTNNHTLRKWDAYYAFTKKNDVDVVMVGNSHLYAGVNPENLSCALGANCFILAAPGTTLTDAYFCLKEAITVCKPKIAVIETYCINDYRSHELKEGRLSDQFQSFHARKNIPQKLLSTPVLFTSDNYLPAWSHTIRNHSYILSDREQIKKNIAAKKVKKKQELYLGRFISFSTGMTDTTLLKYDMPGVASVADGNNYQTGDEARRYIDKIITLCRENNIEPLFLTIPMYHRHIKDYDVWKARLTEELAPYQPIEWLDLQSPYDYDAYVPACFENSVGSNQHLTSQGSLVSAYKLAHFINDKFPGLLADRSEDEQWNNLFYGEGGYFENYAPRTNDTTVNKLFGKLDLPGGLSIKEINMFPKEEYNTIHIKVEKKDGQDLRGKKLQLTADVIAEGRQVTGIIEAETTHAWNPLKHYLFITNLRKDVEILGIRSAEIKN